MSDDLRLSHLTEPQRRALMHTRIRDAEVEATRLRAALQEIVDLPIIDDSDADAMRAIAVAALLEGDAA